MSRDAKRADSMTLLREVIERPLDPGYAAAARRRAAGTAPRMPWWRKLIVLVAAAVLASGTMWAARELRTPTAGASEARTLLLSEIEEGLERGDRLRTANAGIVDTIEQAQEAGLGGVDADYLEYIRLLGYNAGGGRVAGHGLVVTLDDSRDAQAGEPDSDLGRVQDLDLQVVTNGLWAAGAEAVAINGHRLSSVSAIRSAGRAIFVDLAPLTRPYVIEAVGDPEAMRAQLTRSTAGVHLGTLRDAFSISVDLTESEELVLPGSSARTLRHAEPLVRSDPGEGP